MSVIHVPVPKAGKGATIPVETNDIKDDQVFAEIVLQGLKVVLNRGMSKVTAKDITDVKERQAEALRIAGVQLQAVLEGTIRITGGKQKKATGAVMAEARRMAKAMVKDALRAKGYKISLIEPKVITKLANDLLEHDPTIVEKAAAIIDERSKIVIDESILVDVPISDKLVAKAEKDKASKKQLSAAQAGKTRKRSEAAATA